MGTITVQSLVNRASIILHDPTNIRWKASELVDWGSDGQREVVLYKPNASTRNTAQKLVAGTKQTLPADGIQLIDVVRNMGSAGSVPGRAIRIAMREILDAQIPDWHSATPDAVVQHYIYNPQDPKVFYVYPPQPSVNQNYVDVISSIPPDALTIGGTISIDDIYATVLLDYMLYRAYSKDSEYAANKALAESHYAAYIAALTGKAKSEIGNDPNRAAPANPNVSPARQA